MRPGSKTAQLKRCKKEKENRQWEHKSPEKVLEDLKSRCIYTNKEIFVGRKQALGKAALHKKQFNRPYFVYKCPHCKNHHLTTQEQRIMALE